MEAPVIGKKPHNPKHSQHKELQPWLPGFKSLFQGITDVN